VNDDVGDLLPLLESSGFSNVQVAPAPFRVFGLKLLATLSAWRSVQPTMP
jgi:hypothetical protein